MPIIQVRNPIVDINGDEMARVIWEKISDELIDPFINVKKIKYDLGIKSRDNTDDKITIDAANSIKRNKVGIKCATITPDDKRIKEFNLKAKYPSPNGTIRNIINGTIFREPIIIKNIPKIVSHWDNPVVIARHAYGDIYRSKEIQIKEKGELKLSFKSKDKKTIVEKVFDFNSSWSCD